MTAGIPHDAVSGPRGDSGPAGHGGPPRAGHGGWTGGRIIAAVAGSVLTLVSVCLLCGGAVLLWADQSLRHDGYLTTGVTSYVTRGYALASERMDLGWLVTGFIGDVRIRVTATDPATPVFVAIGRADRVEAYLSGVGYATVTGTSRGDLIVHRGTAVPRPPRQAGIWTTQASGTGTQTLRWTADNGDWMAVAMNPDGSPGLTVLADAGIAAPWMFQLAVEFIVGGAALLALSAAMVIVPVQLASRVR